MKLPAFVFRKPADKAESTFAATVHEELRPVDSGDDILVDDAPPGNDRPFDELPTIGHIGRYALKYRLGEGGLGTVYAALDPLLSRPIAVKILHVEVAPANRAALEASFLQEARAAAGLSHPHIVTVHDAGTSDQGLYIAMERLKGADLRQLLQGGWRPTPHQAAQIVRRVADALSYAHDQGVVHCDIKPANIFMLSRTNPKVLDFGIARVAKKPLHGGADIAAGSPFYMAPEQLRGEPVDRRSDVYSLGAVLYELLAGRRAFGHGSLDDIVDAALNQDPVPILELNPQAPAGLATIVQRAMKKDPAQRFRSARQLVAALRLWAANNPVVRTRSPRRGPGWQAVAVFGALVVATALGAGAWRSHSKAQRAAAQQAAEASAAQAAAASQADVWAAERARVSAEVLAAARAASTAEMPSLASSASASASASVASASAASSSATAADSTASAALATSATRPVAAAAAAAVAAAVVKRERKAKAPSGRGVTATPAIPQPTGVLQLAISPWGEVEIDGAAAGTTPPLNHLSLPEGTHAITVRNADFPPYTATVKISGDQPVTLRYRFGS